MRVGFIAVFATLVALLLPPDSASACSCAEASPCEAFGYASAVFVGQVLGGTEKYREYTNKGVTVSLEAGQVRFAVEESFKGVTATEITVLVMNMKGTSCEGMAALARGGRYLVYAGHLQSVGLSIGPCSATKPVDDANADLAFLRSLQPSGSGGRLYGQVAVETGAREPTPLPDVTVVVEDEAHKRVELKTDRDGNFETNGLKPGKYLVNPLLPENYVFRDGRQKNREVQVSDRGCARVPFWVNVNGRIAGRLSDSSGRPAPAYLILESVGEPPRTFLGYTDEEGLFEVQGVPAGKYLLRVDMKKDDKEIAYYHPGTIDRSKATVISISMGQKLDEQNFHLPSTLQVVVLQGTVTYSDGRSAANVEVRLIPDYGSKSAALQVDGSYSDTETDGLGRFTLHGYKGVTYKILALDNLRRAIDEQREAGRAETGKLLLTKDVDDTKVVLPLRSRTLQTKDPQKTTKVP
jgi:hypothetical protein